MTIQPLFLEKKRIVVPLIIFAALFTTLCLFHFFSERPLWQDENYILYNLQERSYGELFNSQLRYSQAFPRVYLAVIKFVVSHFDYHVLALRVFSLVAMLSAFWVWVRIYQKVFPDHLLFLAGVFSFASSFYLCYYAAELKPYSMDVLVVGLYCLYFLNQKRFESENPSAASMLLAGLLPLSMLFSYGSFFVFWMVGFNYLLLLGKNKKVLPLLLINGLVSLGILFIIYNTALKFSLQRLALFEYWDSYFLSTASFGEFMEAFWEGVRRLAIWWHGRTRFLIRAGTPFIPLMVYALFRYGYRAWVKDGFRIFTVGSAAAIVFLELFVLGLLKKYPFTGERVTLFFAPLAFYLIILGINDLRRFRWPYVILGSYYFLYLMMCSANAITVYLQALVLGRLPG